MAIKHTIAVKIPILSFSPTKKRIYFPAVQTTKNTEETRG